MPQAENICAKIQHIIPSSHIVNYILLLGAGLCSCCDNLTLKAPRYLVHFAVRHSFFCCGDISKHA